eukprot:Seg4032.2 transcript_id=Seg4032.2/GoldUCD/mRNA.D3Y31 product="hypothetical protein" protein_id=Seg4032.2/GoldUCD/D3Y31
MCKGHENYMKVNIEFYFALYQQFNDLLVSLITLLDFASTIMKVFVFLALVCSVLADEYELSVNDGTDSFKEKIEVDLAANTELLKLPAHGSSPAANVLYDFNVGYAALRTSGTKQDACYVEAIDPNHPDPQSLKQSMDAYDSTQRHPKRTQSKQVEVDRQLKPSETGAKIAAHCVGLPMYLMKEVTGNKANTFCTQINIWRCWMVGNIQICQLVGIIIRC